MKTKLDTSDNVYKKKENDEIILLTKCTSVESWVYFTLWSFIPFIAIKWAFWGSERFPWARACSIVSLITGVLIGIPLVLANGLLVF